MLVPAVNTLTSCPEMVVMYAYPLLVHMNSWSLVFGTSWMVWIGCSLLTVDPGTSPGLSINTTPLLHHQYLLYLLQKWLTYNADTDTDDADDTARWTYRKVCKHSVVRRSHSFTVPSADPVSTEPLLLLSFVYNPQFTYEEWPLMR